MPGRSLETLPSRSQSGPCKKSESKAHFEQPHRTAAQGPNGLRIDRAAPSKGQARPRAGPRPPRAGPRQDAGPDEGRTVPAGVIIEAEPRQARAKTKTSGLRRHEKCRSGRSGNVGDWTPRRPRGSSAPLGARSASSFFTKPRVRLHKTARRDGPQEEHHGAPVRVLPPLRTVKVAAFIISGLRAGQPQRRDRRAGGAAVGCLPGARPRTGSAGRRRDAPGLAAEEGARRLRNHAVGAPNTDRQEERQFWGDCRALRLRRVARRRQG